MIGEASILAVDLPWADRELDDLLAALRRHDVGEAARLLRAIRPDPAALLPPNAPWQAFAIGRAGLDLHTWTRAEALQHVEQGRPEYALALVERYRREFDADDMRARNPQQPRPCHEIDR
jgi:hypothetical protein